MQMPAASQQYRRQPRRSFSFPALLSIAGRDEQVQHMMNAALSALEAPGHLQQLSIPEQHQDEEDVDELTASNWAQQAAQHRHSSPQPGIIRSSRHEGAFQVNDPVRDKARMQRNTSAKASAADVAYQDQGAQQPWDFWQQDAPVKPQQVPQQRQPTQQQAPMQQQNNTLQQPQQQHILLLRPRTADAASATTAASDYSINRSSSTPMQQLLDRALLGPGSGLPNSNSSSARMQQSQNLLGLSAGSTAAVADGGLNRPPPPRLSLDSRMAAHGMRDGSAAAASSSGMFGAAANLPPRPARSTSAEAMLLQQLAQQAAYTQQQTMQQQQQLLARATSPPPYLQGLVEDVGGYYPAMAAAGPMRLSGASSLPLPLAAAFRGGGGGGGGDGGGGGGGGGGAFVPPQRSRSPGPMSGSGPVQGGYFNAPRAASPPPSAATDVTSAAAVAAATIQQALAAATREIDHLMQLHEVHKQRVQLQAAARAAVKRAMAAAAAAGAPNAQLTYGCQQQQQQQAFASFQDGRIRSMGSGGVSSSCSSTVGGGIRRCTGSEGSGGSAASSSSGPSAHAAHDTAAAVGAATSAPGGSESAAALMQQGSWSQASQGSGSFPFAMPSAGGATAPTMDYIIDQLTVDSEQLLQMEQFMHALSANSSSQGSY